MVKIHKIVYFFWFNFLSMILLNKIIKQIKMPYKIYKTYKQLLDIKLNDSTFLVIIIAFLIISVWIIVPQSSFANWKNNIQEIQKKNNLEFQNIINLNGKKYKVYFEEIK